MLRPVRHRHRGGRTGRGAVGGLHLPGQELLRHLCDRRHLHRVWRPQVGHVRAVCRVPATDGESRVLLRGVPRPGLDLGALRRARRGPRGAPAALHALRETIHTGAPRRRALLLRSVPAGRVPRTSRVLIDAGQAAGTVATKAARPTSVQLADSSSPVTLDDLDVDKRRLAEWRKVRNVGAAGARRGDRARRGTAERNRIHHRRRVLPVRFYAQCPRTANPVVATSPCTCGAPQKLPRPSSSSTRARSGASR